MGFAGLEFEVLEFEVLVVAGLEFAGLCFVSLQVCPSMKTIRRHKPWKLLFFLAVLCLVQTSHADGVAAGDPKELVPLGIAGIVWLALLAGALAGLRRIRRSYDVLPPP